MFFVAEINLFICIKHAVFFSPRNFDFNELFIGQYLLEILTLHTLARFLPGCWCLLRQEI